MRIPFFGKKKKELVPARVPVDRVNSLTSQGLSETDVIKSLRDEGYSPMEVEQAIKESLRSKAVPPGANLPSPQETAGPPAPPGEPPMEGPPGPPQGPYWREPQKPPEDDLSMPQLPGEPRRGPAPPEADLDEELPAIPQLEGKPKSQSRRDVEEVAESIIEEKWDAMQRESDELKQKIKSMESKITDLEGKISQLREVKGTEFQDIKTRIDVYNQSISEISARMEAIEKTMKDSLTPMMQSLRSLSDTIKAIKGKK